MAVLFRSLLLKAHASILRFSLALVTCSTFVGADEFIVPSNAVADLALHFELGQTVQVSWQTSLDVLTLLVSHWGGNTVGALLSEEQNTGVYNWKIGENDNINEDTIKEGANFVLLIRDPSSQTANGNGFVNGQLSSRAFTIKSNQTSSSSSIASSSTTSAISSTSPPPTSTASSTTAPPAATTSPSGSSSSLSSGAKGGIATGASLAGLALIAAGIWLGVRYARRKSSSPGQQQGAPTSNPNTATPMSPAPLVHGPYEVDAREQSLHPTGDESRVYPWDQNQRRQYLKGSASELPSDTTRSTVVGSGGSSAGAGTSTHEAGTDNAMSQ